MSYYHSQEDNNYPKALWISSGIMGGLLILSFIIMIGSAFPDIGTGGIIVNYGTSDVGMGDDYMTVDEASTDPNANNIRPDTIDPEQDIPEPPEQQVTEQRQATKDTDTAQSLVANESPKAPEDKNTQT